MHGNNYTAESQEQTAGGNIGRNEELMNFKDYIKTHNILADGSFGTYYAEKYHTNEAPEYIN